MEPSSIPAGPPAPAEHGSRADDVAARLLTARRILGSLELPAEASARLQRRLLAICDALKVSGADSARGAKRLDRFIEELRRAGGQGA